MIIKTIFIKNISFYSIHYKIIQNILIDIYLIIIFNNPAF